MKGCGLQIRVLNVAVEFTVLPNVTGMSSHIGSDQRARL